MLSRAFLLFSLSLVLLISACTGYQNNNIKREAVEACISLCQAMKEKGMNLTAGPCLSDDEPSWKIERWVCDVAHWPRRDVDNLPENQCEEFRTGMADHFVEVDENCDLIRVY